MNLIILCAALFGVTAVISGTPGGFWSGSKSQALARHPNPTDFSLHGNTFSESISELRIYRTRDRHFRFYDLPVLSRKELLFRTDDREIIARILKSADMGPELGERSYCRRLKMDYQLHIVTLKKGGKPYGYFIVSPNEAARNAPSELKGNCTSVTFSGINMDGWDSYLIFRELRKLGIDF